MDGGRVIICPNVINTLLVPALLLEESLTSSSDLSQGAWLMVDSLRRSHGSEENLLSLA